MKVSKIFGIVAATILCSSPAYARNKSAEARSVLELTKTTNSTYSLYIWNRVTKQGEPAFEEASAEFHHGDYHRVETPRDRIVANCRTQTGYYLSVDSGEIVEGPQVAAAACGINTNSPFVSMELLANVRTKWGKARRVRVVDRQNIREYDVMKNGALVRTTYTENRTGGSLLILAEALRMEGSLPDEAMFSRESLAKSFLPTELKR